MTSIALNPICASNPAAISRRRFLGGTVAGSAVASSVGLLRSLAADAPATSPKPAELARKIRLGVVGTGGRGAWIANLFKQHGGYEMWAVADYFPNVANTCGHALGVDQSRCFSSLSGYK